ncbi:MAG: Rossmann fold nucleotide-binding protein [Nostocoides sp.]
MTPNPRPRRAHREVDSLAQLHEVLSTRKTLCGIRIQNLDLSAAGPQLLRRSDFAGLVVLGGRVPEDVATHLRSHGAILFPAAFDAPVDVYPSGLYTPDDLYAGLESDGYDATPDARAYRWSRDPALAGDVYVTLLRAIHDDSITDALDERLAGRRVAGVMGGHAVQRGDDAYAATAHLGHRLAESGLVVVTGGGPGAMEAANFGALTRHTSALDPALARLAAVPSFRTDIGAWAALALEVRADLVDPAESAVDGTVVRSIGIPTWFYGHEPPNVFCDGIAKYFSNALREDGLLARSTAGVVVMPGAAGTVQEIFQAVTPLYYAPKGAELPRLVLVGRDHWTRAVPVWPALASLAAGKAMADRVALVDDAADAADLLAQNGRSPG